MKKVSDLEVALLAVLWRRNKRQMFLEASAKLVVEYPLIPQCRLSLDDFNDADCTLAFRFDRRGLESLAVHLRLPDVLITSKRDRCNTIEAVAIMLYRLAYPVRFATQIRVFGRSTPSMCRIFLTTVALVYERWSEHLFFPLRLISSRLEQYAQAVQGRGGVVPGVFGFIDGTKIATCRISGKNNLQKQIYSGHKRVHCLNFQCVTVPDGLWAHFYGPVEGKTHDSSMLRMSGLREKLAEHAELFHQKYIYGDPAYGVSTYVISPYKGDVSEDEAAFNSAMSSVRESVEWSFGRMKTLWAYVDFKKSHKIMLSPVGKIVYVSMLLTNCRCCYYRGIQISAYFLLTPPTLAEYLE
jgi:nuclease HARBI1